MTTSLPLTPTAQVPGLYQHANVKTHHPTSLDSFLSIFYLENMSIGAEDLLVLALVVVGINQRYLTEHDRSR